MTHFGYEKHKVETLQPPIIAGPLPREGRWWAPMRYSGSFNANTTASGRTYYSYFFLPGDLTVTSLGFWCRSGGGGATIMRVGVYSDVDSNPNTLLASANIAPANSLTSTGAVSVTLSAGGYWFGCKPNDAARTASTLIDGEMSATLQRQPFILDAGAEILTANNNTTVITEDAEGALPTTAVSPTRVATAMPGIYLRG